MNCDKDCDDIIELEDDKNTKDVYVINPNEINLNSKLEKYEGKEYIKSGVVYNNDPIPDGYKPVRAYLRTSTQMQIFDKFSIPVQESMIRDFCKNNKLWIKAIYIDRGITGTANTITRKAFGKLIGVTTINKEGNKTTTETIDGDLLPGEGIIATECTRLYRDIAELAMLYKRWRDNGSFLYVLQLGGLINDQNQKWLSYCMFAMVGEQERKTTSERCKATYQYMKEQGKNMNSRGRAKFGYEWVRDDKGRITGELEFNEEEYLVVKFIREIKKKDPKMKISKVITELENEYPAASYGRKEWQPMVIIRIIENPDNEIHNEVVKQVRCKKNETWVKTKVDKITGEEIKE